MISVDENADWWEGKERVRIVWKLAHRENSTTLYITR
jgi:hypothetical protein